MKRPITMKKYLRLVILLYTTVVFGQEYEKAQSIRDAKYPEKSERTKASGQIQELDNIVLQLHASPSGSPTGKGTQVSPLTITAARDSLRTYKLANGSLPAGKIVVYLEGGVYDIETDNLILSKQDSGTEKSPIYYMSQTGQRVTFSGGVTIPFSYVTKPPQSVIDKILNTDAKRQVRQISLADLNLDIDDKGRYRTFPGAGQNRRVNGDIVPNLEPEGQLYINDRRLRYSTYPKKGEGNHGDGFARMASVVDRGSARRNAHSQNSKGGSFTYSDENIDNIDPSTGAVVYGYYGATYDDVAERIGRLDPATNTIELAEGSWYGINYENDAADELRFRIENTIEYLSDEMEIAVDESAGVLYFIPPSGFDSNSTIKLSLSTKTGVSMTEVEHVTVQGVDIELTRLKGIKGSNVNNVTLKDIGCFNLEGNGIEFPTENVFNNLIENYNFRAIRNHPAIFGGGVYLTQEDGRCRMVNVKGYDFGRHLQISGVNTQLLNLELELTPGRAISVNGQSIEIGYSKFISCAQEVGDSGVIYLGRTLTNPGLWIHDVFSYRNENKQSGTGVQFVYSDDRNSFLKMERVIGAKTGSGAQPALFKTNGGTEQVVENCISWGRNLAFVQIHTNKQWQNFVAGNDNANLPAKLSEVGYDNPSSKFNKIYPKVNEIVELSERPALDRNILKDNVVFNATIARGILNGRFVDLEATGVTDINNTVIKYNPGFEDPENGDFSISRSVWDSDPVLKELDYIDVTRMGYIESGTAAGRQR
ncbi:MAG: hypothetical protein WA913_00315 [Pricia sp.]